MVECPKRVVERIVTHLMCGRCSKMKISMMANAKQMENSKQGNMLENVDINDC